MYSTDPRPGILIAADVIDPSELASRVAQAQAAIAPAMELVVASRSETIGIEPLESLATLRSRLAELQAHTSYFSTQRLHQAPGVRGRLAYEFKRTVRRATSWYVEPRWMLQDAVNIEVGAILERAELQLVQLRDDLDELAMWRRRVDHDRNGDVQR